MAKMYSQNEGKKYYDENGKFKWEASQDSSQSDSASESESDASVKASDNEEDIWKSDDEPEQLMDAQVTKKLALTNLDWDNINAADLFVLFNSLCK